MNKIVKTVVQVITGLFMSWLYFMLADMISNHILPADRFASNKIGLVVLLLYIVIMIPIILITVRKIDMK